MNYRVLRITRALQEYDSELYACHRFGRIDVLRKGFKYESYDVDGAVINVLRPNDWYVFSLTTNWNMTGAPCEWGIEPILAHLKAGDLQKRDLASEIIEQKERKDASDDRKIQNEAEAFFSDNRRAISKHWGEVNTSLLDKRVDRRYRDEKKLKTKG